MLVKILGLIFILLFLAGCESGPEAVSSAQSSNTPTTFDTPPVTYAIFPSNIVEDTQSGWIFLAYSDEENHVATSCTISNRSYVNISSACVCAAGICRVKVTGFSNYYGPVSFQYSVTANNQTSGTSLATFFITPVAEAPVANEYAFSMVQDTTHTSAGVPSLPNLSGRDPDGDTLACSAVAAPLHGSVTVNPDCSFSYTPTAAYSGPDSFTFRVTDGTFNSSPARVDVLVTRVNVAPVTAATSVSTYQYTPVTFTPTASDPNGDAIEYLVVSAPAHGNVVFNGSSAYYVPLANYIGTDTFTFIVNDGVLVSNISTVTITVQSPSFYLSATGNDSTAVMNDPAKPFLTVQALMNKVALFGPTSAKPVKIYVGAGNFGNATMTTGFGSNVTWIGTSAATSIIGNLTFTTPSGAAGVAVGDPSVGDYDGKNGTNGRVVTIEADWNITFGNITANGGNGGLHAPDVATKKSHPGLPGGGGVLNLTGYFGTITAKGGNGHAGGAGGQVNLRAGSTSASIDMSGGDDLCTIATSCYTERDAGMGGNIGVLGGAIVTGNVTADGGKNNGKAPTYVNVAGRGGNIHIEGRVNGNVYARGGDSGESQVGEGGVYGDVAGAVVTGDVYLTTGASSSNGDFSAAGSAEIFGTVRDVIAYSHPVMGGMGGNVELRGIARNIHVEAAFVGCDNSSAGEVNVYFGGTATNVYAGGGDNACTDQTNGYVGVYGTVTGTVNVAGGNNINSTYSPGQSGDVRVYANGVVNFIVATGGNALATTCKVGGKGGLVELTAGATYNLANIDVSGGTGDTGCGSANGASGTINNI